MTKKNERTGAFKYCAKLIGEVLAARKGGSVSPEKLKAAIWRKAELEDKTHLMRSNIDRVAQELEKNPQDSILFTGGLITRIQDGWKKKINGYVLTPQEDEVPGPAPEIPAHTYEGLANRIRDLEINDRRREMELAELKRKIWGRQAPLFGEEKTHEQRR